MNYERTRHCQIFCLTTIWNQIQAKRVSSFGRVNFKLVNETVTVY